MSKRDKKSHFKRIKIEWKFKIESKSQHKSWGGQCIPWAGRVAPRILAEALPSKNPTSSF